MNGPTSPVLTSVSIPVREDADPLAFVRDAETDGRPAGVWTRPGLAAGGVGAAAVETASGPDRFSELREGARRIFDGAVSDGGPPQAFAGGAFVDERKPVGEDDWHAFPDAAVWIPELALVATPEGVRLVASTTSRDASAGARLEELIAHGLAIVESPKAFAPLAEEIGGIETTPANEAWEAAVAAALTRIGDGGLRKVVLARRRRLNTTGPGRPWDLAAVLRARYPDAHTYAYAWNGATFVGASPELLVWLSEGEVRSSPAAGTVAGGASLAEDRRLAGGLDTVKSRYEQEIVADAVYDALEEWCEEMHASLPAVVHAGPVQHLVTTVTGRLSKPAHVLDLVGALHPTPAVAGLPRADALAFIHEAEGFDRGWYAGPIGIVDSGGGGEFAVALRGALVHDSTDLFAGAGIVEGSVPAEERAEIELKLRAVTSALTG